MVRMREWIKGKEGVAVCFGMFALLLAAFIIDAGRNTPRNPAPLLRFQVSSEPYAIIPDVYGTGGPPMAVAIGLGILVFGGAWWFFRTYTPRVKPRPDVRAMEYHLATWVILLDRGDHYDRVIAGIAAEDLSRLASRRLAAERLAAAIRPEDIREGFSVLPSKSRFPNRLARDAKRLIEDQAAAVAREGVPEGDACLLLFTCTDLGVEPVPLDASPEQLSRAMRISVVGHPGDDSVMFVRHRLLEEAAGRRIVEALRANVLPGTRTV